MSYAKWCLHIFICFLIISFQTKSTEYQNKHADDVKLICNNCHNFILQQDGARCRTSSYALSYICVHVAEPLGSKVGPPHSSDRNHLGYCGRSSRFDPKTSTLSRFTLVEEKSCHRVEANNPDIYFRQCRVVNKYLK